jgi:hypothetical protein
LPQILSLQISQFGARLKELRGLGFNIPNRQEHHGGQTHSFYRLVSGPTSPAPAPVVVPTPTDSKPETLFELGLPDRSYLE